jgi:LPS-assembly lipoprotein
MKAFAAGCLILLSACALTPVYEGGAASAPATLLASVEVAPIPERTGFLVREQLVQQLPAPASGEAARYRLKVTLDDRIDGFGVRGDNTIIRERRTLRARYALVELASGTTVFESVAGVDAGIDVVSSEYAVVAAEVTASERLAEAIADQILARLSVWARR